MPLLADNDDNEKAAVGAGSESVVSVMLQVIGWTNTDKGGKGLSEGSSAQGAGGLRLSVTTPLLWLIWFGTSFGAQGFNMYLPSLLDRKGVTQASHLYRDLLVYNLAGIPGIYTPLMRAPTHATLTDLQRM
jgi:hypothetical protein